MRVGIGMPVVRTDARSVARSVGHVITKFSGMAWVDYLSYGAPPTSVLRARMELRVMALYPTVILRLPKCVYHNVKKVPKENTPR